MNVWHCGNDNPLPMLKELPHGLVVLRLKNLLQDRIAGPFGSSITKDMYTQSGFRVYGQEQVIPGDFSIGDYYISEVKYRAMRRFAVTPGDVLVSCVGTFGKVAVVPDRAEPGIINPRLIKLVPNRLRVEPEYLALVLKSLICFHQLEQMSRGGTMGVVNLGILDELRLPVPALKTQRMLLRFLDRKTQAIDSLIQKKERLIALLQEKRQALITQAVTKGLDPNVPMKDSGIEWLGEIPAHWEVLQLGKTIKLQRGFDITKNEQQLGPVPVISSGGIFSYHSYSMARGPGVVIGRKGTLGTVHYVATDYWPHDTTLWVKEFCGNLPRFVYYKLLSMALERLDTGSANPTLNRNLAHPIRVSWPPIPEQNHIVDVLDAFSEKTKQVSEQILMQIDRLREYRQALISAAVTGKIDVTKETI